MRQQLLSEQKKTIDEVLHDIESLLPHTQFLFDKINFQLEVAMGFTNLQQNKVIKIFSVAARCVPASNANRQHVRDEL